MGEKKRKKKKGANLQAVIARTTTSPNFFFYYKFYYDKVRATKTKVVSQPNRVWSVVRESTGNRTFTTQSQLLDY